MLQLAPQSRIWLALAPVDFRKGIDGLAGVCRGRFAQNPLDGAIYVFRNRAGTTPQTAVLRRPGILALHQAPLAGPAPVVAARGRRRRFPGGPRAAGAALEWLPRPGRHGRRLASGGLKPGSGPSSRGRQAGRQVLLIIPRQPRRRLAEHGGAMGL